MNKKTLTRVASPRFKRGAPPRIAPRFPRKKPVPGMAAPARAPGDAAPAAEVEVDADADASPEAVAELEAVIGTDDEGEAPEPREADEPSNFLAMYFRDMARLAVLRPQEEFEAARRIEQLEIAVWAYLLAHPPILDHVLKVVERTMENSLPEFKILRKPFKKTEAEKRDRVVVKV